MVSNTILNILYCIKKKRKNTIYIIINLHYIYVCMYIYVCLKKNMLLYTFYNINVCKFILTIFPLNPFYRNIRFTYICAYICTYVLTFRARFILYVFCILSRSMYCIYIYICTARMKVQNIKVSFSYIFISCTLMTWEYM